MEERKISQDVGYWAVLPRSPKEDQLPGAERACILGQATLTVFLLLCHIFHLFFFYILLFNVAVRKGKVAL